MALDLSDTAKRLIRSLAGRSEDALFYILKKTGGSEDPITGEYTPGTVTRTAVDGALVGYNQSLVDGANIRADDFRLIMPGDAPWENGDSVEIYGKEYAVINPGLINHAGVPQVYIAQVRSS